MESYPYDFNMFGMQKFIIRDKCWRYCRNKKQCKLRTCGNGNYELQVPNNEFPFCLVVFAGADIYQCSDNRSAFQAAIAVMSLSAGRWPAVMKVIAFQATVSRWIENFDCNGYFCIRGCFWLEKPNFHKELQVTNFELRMRSSALFNLRLSTWTYLFFSRRSTLIFFSLIHADLFSAPICDFNLRISAWTVFSEFSHPRPNIPQNYSSLKIRGVPPKAGKCYDVNV